MASTKQHGSGGFWDWLAKNSDRVRAGVESKRVTSDIAREFDKSYPGLVWEITPRDDGGDWLFCISADGDRERFARVERAVREAPAVKGWTIQAFRQRGPADAEITVNGQTLAGDDVWCEVDRAKGGGIDLVLHLRGVTIETEEVLSQAALILLDNAIGEYDSVMRIASIDLALLEGNPKATARFFPLRDLPAYLDRL